MKKIFLLLIGGMFLLFSLQSSANSSILSNKDISLYKSIFQLQKKGKIKEAKLKEQQLKNSLLRGYVLYDRYFSKNYKTSSKEITDWMKNYSDYPIASEIYALGKQKNIKKLPRPKGIFGGNTKACDSIARVEPLDLVRAISFNYSDKEKRISAQKKCSQ